MTVAAAGAQVCRLAADSAVIVTVVAMGAVTTRPLGWGAVIVTYRESGCKSEGNLGGISPGWV